MTDFIVAMLNALGDGNLQNTAELMKSPKDFSPTVYQAALGIHNNAVKPITAVVLSIMAVVMLANASAKMEGDRELGVKMIAATMFKIIMVIAVVQNAVLILEAINEVATSLMTSIANTDVGGTAAGTKLGDKLKDKIGDEDDVNQLAMLVILFLPWLLTEVVSVIALVLLYARFLQLYMLTAFASLPVAFLGHEDTKSMGIGYLKRYGTTALQGARIVLAFKLYQALISGLITKKIQDGDKVFGSIAMNFPWFFLSPLVLAFLLVGASSLAKAVVGEG